MLNADRATRHVSSSPRHLLSVMTLKNRAYDLYDPEHLERVLEHVQEVLKGNGYQAYYSSVVHEAIEIKKLKT